MSSSSSSLITNPSPVRHAPAEWMPTWMSVNRTKMLSNQEPKINSKGESSKSVVYWMQRDVRSVDNWALLWAAHLASRHGLSLHVVHVLPPPPQSSVNENDPPGLIDTPMTARHGRFLLSGLELVHGELWKLGIPLHVVLPSSHESVGEIACGELMVERLRAAVVVADFTPLRHVRQWMELQGEPVLTASSVPFCQVDAHNVIPVWIASDKREVGARTLRPRIHRQLADYLDTDFPDLQDVLKEDKMPQAEPVLFDRSMYEEFLNMDTSVPPVDWARAGTEAAMERFDSFCDRGLKAFADKRNDPVQSDVCSGLSPWLNHGHVSFQRLLSKVKPFNKKYADGTKAYVEEGLIRRELSDNFLYYAPNDYDSLAGAAEWARLSLELHASDPREHMYSLEEFEAYQTHDDLWNAAQKQLVTEGRMHGFLRMYWAKKILEWTAEPVAALRIAQYLNDRYALDGRDPNGFVGVGWSVMGIHDMGWKERPVFGKIRYMNYAGCKRKFNVAAFVGRYSKKSDADTKAKAKMTRKLTTKGEHPNKKKRTQMTTKEAIRGAAEKKAKR